MFNGGERMAIWCYFTFKFKRKFLLKDWYQNLVKLPLAFQIISIKATVRFKTFFELLFFKSNAKSQGFALGRY